MKKKFKLINIIPHILVAVTAIAIIIACGEGDIINVDTDIQTRKDIILANQALDGKLKELGESNSSVNISSSGTELGESSSGTDLSSSGTELGESSSGTDLSSSGTDTDLSSSDTEVSSSSSSGILYELVCKINDPIISSDQSNKFAAFDDPDHPTLRPQIPVVECVRTDPDYEGSHKVIPVDPFDDVKWAPISWTSTGLVERVVRNLSVTEFDIDECKGQSATCGDVTLCYRNSTNTICQSSSSVDASSSGGEEKSSSSGGSSSSVDPSLPTITCAVAKTSVTQGENIAPPAITCSTGSTPDKSLAVFTAAAPGSLPKNVANWNNTTGSINAYYDASPSASSNAITVSKVKCDNIEVAAKSCGTIAVARPTCEVPDNPKLGLGNFQIYTVATRNATTGIISTSASSNAQASIPAPTAKCGNATATVPKFSVTGKDDSGTPSFDGGWNSSSSGNWGFGNTYEGRVVRMYQLSCDGNPLVYGAGSARENVINCGAINIKPALTCTSLPATLTAGQAIDAGTQNGFLTCTNTGAKPTSTTTPPTWAAIAPGATSSTNNIPINGTTVTSTKGTYTSIYVTANCGIGYTSVKSSDNSGCSNITVGDAPPATVVGCCYTGKSSTTSKTDVCKTITSATTPNTCATQTATTASFLLASGVPCQTAGGSDSCPAEIGCCDWGTSGDGGCWAYKKDSYNQCTGTGVSWVLPGGSCSATGGARRGNCGNSLNCELTATTGMVGSAISKPTVTCDGGDEMENLTFGNAPVWDNPATATTYSNITASASCGGVSRTVTCKGTLVVSPKPTATCAWTSSSIKVNEQVSPNITCPAGSGNVDKSGATFTATGAQPVAIANWKTTTTSYASSGSSTVTVSGVKCGEITVADVSCPVLTITAPTVTCTWSTTSYVTNQNVPAPAISCGTGGGNPDLSGATFTATGTAGQPASLTAWKSSGSTTYSAVGASTVKVSGIKCGTIPVDEATCTALTIKAPTATCTWDGKNATKYSGQTLAAPTITCDYPTGAATGTPTGLPASTLVKGTFNPDLTSIRCGGVAPSPVPSCGTLTVLTAPAINTCAQDPVSQTVTLPATPTIPTITLTDPDNVCSADGSTTPNTSWKPTWTVKKGTADESNDTWASIFTDAGSYGTYRVSGKCGNYTPNIEKACSGSATVNASTTCDGSTNNSSTPTVDKCYDVKGSNNWNGCTSTFKLKNYNKSALSGILYCRVGTNGTLSTSQVSCVSGEDVCTVTPTCSPGSGGAAWLYIQTMTGSATLNLTCYE